ncbi:AMP-binding protein [Novosphingobium sp.]|uniref:class I adenylate-forming enzyme family protein n=1 Tax=Novosphingobium sp. TaxID=1874826 RepID=UPI0025DFFFE0|nr:AMP-binding protein [Novosphingobium sp.]
MIAPDGLSIAHGIPLADEPGLGALTLPGFLREVCERHPNREALVEHRPDGGVLRWTYAALWQEAMAVARALTAGGLAKGERVAVLMTNRAEFLAAMFGIGLAGGVATPFGTFSTAPEIEHLLWLSACSVLLFEPQVLRKDFASILHDLVPGLKVASSGGLAVPQFPFLRRVVALDLESGAGAIERWQDFITSGADVSDATVTARAATVAPADPGVVFFSSGSTARPKGVLSAHRAVAIQCWRMARHQGLGAATRSWTANGFFWSGNFAMVMGATLASGGVIVLQRTFDPGEALRLMAAERVTFLFAWPHQWEQLVGAPGFAEADLSALVELDPAGPIARHPTVSTRWIEPRHAYGNTETFTLSTGYPAGTTQDAGGNSHGLPLPGNTLKIVDPLTGALVPLGERGEIAIKGPTLMLGYLGVPLDETLDDQGFFRTGDGGWIDAQGRLVWEGRLSDVIKTGGANVSPLEIDAVLLTCPGVRLSQTVGVPHATLGELVVACVVPHDGATVTEDMVRDFAKARLASYKVPRRVLVCAAEDLEMTGSAKVRTTALRSLVGERIAAGR